MASHVTGERPAQHLGQPLRTAVRNELERHLESAEAALEDGPFALAKGASVGQAPASLGAKVGLVALPWWRRGGAVLALTAAAAPLVMLTLAMLVTDAALIHTPWPVQLIVVVACLSLVISAGSVLYMLVFRDSRPHLLHFIAGWSLVDKVFWTVIVVLAPTVAIAVVTAFTIRHGWMPVAGSPADANLAFQSFATLMWELADAVPFLKVPETLEWKPALDFTTPYGDSVLLAYKLVVLLPLAQLITLLAQRAFTESAEGRAADRD